uniref:Myosin motor domain-containing protein n=1 Tax=Arcella intermedia TaxID=1963864 RepID=A0A6B2KVZ5_9EUKA
MTLKETRKAQSIVISGESGSGKTEATKIFLNFLTEASKTEKKKDELHLADRIQATNPIMEAFGNAKTTRNNNSSRFGKFIKIIFEDDVICGAQIDNYLLEKTRVISQALEERNYHIFYQIINYTSQEQQEKYRIINDASKYEYMKNGNLQLPHSSADYNDEKEFQKVLSGFKTLGFTDQEVDNIFEILSAVLWLGNTKFTADSSDASELVDSEALNNFCSLLGFAPAKVKEALTREKLQIAMRSSTNIKILTALKAYEYRDAFAKALYSGLFDWLVNKLNNQLKGNATSNDVFIGVLDIYGFEDFKPKKQSRPSGTRKQGGEESKEARNSIEQFLINFANEKLHQQFIHHMFKSEQEDYEKEGIRWDTIKLNDNSGCINLIEKIITLLRDKAKIARVKDEDIAAELRKTHGPNTNFAKPTNDDGIDAIGIAHYAGPVIYNMEQWMDKNGDNISGDIVRLMATSSNKIVQQFYPSAEPESAPTPQASPFGGRQPKAQASAAPAKKSVCERFKDDLSRLVEVLSSSERYYVRCLKPNDLKSPKLFDSPKLMQQLKCNGVFETVTLRKKGFSSRIPYESFADRFWICLGDKRNRSGIEEFLSKLLTGENASFWSTGNTKVFLKDKAVQLIQMEQKKAWGDKVVKAQAFIRGYYQATKFKLKKEAAIKIQAIAKKLANEKHFKISQQRVVKIQNLVRTAHAISKLREYQLEYALKVKSSIKIQSHVRRFFAVVQFERLKEEKRRREEEERRRIEEEKKRKEEEQRIKAQEEEKRRKDAEKKEAERKEAEKKEAERKEAEKEAKRKEAERKEAEKKESERKENERKSQTGRKSEKKDEKKHSTKTETDKNVSFGNADKESSGAPEEPAVPKVKEITLEEHFQQRAKDNLIPTPRNRMRTSSRTPRGTVTSPITEKPQPPNYDNDIDNTTIEVPVISVPEVVSPTTKSNSSKEKQPNSSSSKNTAANNTDTSTSTTSTKNTTNNVPNITLNNTPYNNLINIPTTNTPTTPYKPSNTNTTDSNPATSLATKTTSTPTPQKFSLQLPTKPGTSSGAVTPRSTPREVLIQREEEYNKRLKLLEAQKEERRISFEKELNQVRRQEENRFIEESKEEELRSKKAEEEEMERRKRAALKEEKKRLNYEMEEKRQKELFELKKETEKKTFEAVVVQKEKDWMEQENLLYLKELLDLAIFLAGDSCNMTEEEMIETQKFILSVFNNESDVSTEILSIFFKKNLTLETMLSWIDPVQELKNLRLPNDRLYKLDKQLELLRTQQLKSRSMEICVSILKAAVTLHPQTSGLSNWFSNPNLYVRCDARESRQSVQRISRFRTKNFEGLNPVWCNAEGVATPFNIVIPEGWNLWIEVCDSNWTLDNVVAETWLTWEQLHKLTTGHRYLTLKFIEIKENNENEYLLGHYVGEILLNFDNFSPKPIRWNSDILGSDFQNIQFKLLPDGFHISPLTATLTRPQSNKARNAILYLHDFSDYFWQEDMAYNFLKNGFSFYALDLRKYGRSKDEGARPNWMEGITDYYEEVHWAISIMKAEGMEKISLGGLGFGGVIATFFSIDHPSLIQSLLLLNPQFTFTTKSWTKLVSNSKSWLGNINPLHKDMQFSLLHHQSLHTEQKGKWNWDLSLKPLNGWPLYAGWVDILQKSIAELLKKNAKLQVPLLLLLSEQTFELERWDKSLQESDMFLEADKVEDIAKQLSPKLSCHRIPHAGHDILHSNPDVVQQAYSQIWSFLSQLS